VIEEKEMGKERGFAEGLIAAVSIGGFLVLVGIIFVINQNLLQKINDFFNDFNTVQLPNTTLNVPAPLTPAAHTAVYSATFQFALGIAILQILILALRLGLGSRIRRTAGTVGSLVFWFGAAYLLNNLAQMSSTLSQNQQYVLWFQFWAAIIALIGVSLVIRGAIVFLARRR